MNVREEMLAGMIRCRLAEDQRIGGQTIDVFVAGGDVYLRGTVDSLEQRKMVEGLVNGVPGVKRTFNSMHLRHGLVHPG